MQSLDDLELERESGGIDDESYAELHDDYTARAAAVIRTLRDGVDVTPTRRRRCSGPRPSSGAARRRRRRVRGRWPGCHSPYALGARLPGQTSSGNSAAAPSTTNASAKALAAKITELEKQGERSEGRLSTCASQLARAYEENGDLANALKQSDAAITIDANRPEGHANAARLLYLASSQVPSRRTRRRSSWPKRWRVSTRRSRSVPTTPTPTTSARCSTRRPRDFARSQNDLQHYLVLAPTGQWSAQARQLLAQVTAALESPSTTVPPTTSRPKKQ